MIILHADTTTKKMSASLYKDGEWITEYFESGRHSVHILRLIDTLLNRNDIMLSDIDFFSVCKGPGSFTGTRIGVLTMLGFSRICKKDLVYVCDDYEYSDIITACRNKDFSHKAEAIYNSRSYFEKKEGRV